MGPIEDIKILNKELKKKRKREQKQRREEEKKLKLEETALKQEIAIPDSQKEQEEGLYTTNDEDRSHLKSFIERRLDTQRPMSIEGGLYSIDEWGKLYVMEKELPTDESQKVNKHVLYTLTADTYKLNGRHL